MDYYEYIHGFDSFNIETIHKLCDTGREIEGGQYRNGICISLNRLIAFCKWS